MKLRKLYLLASLGIFLVSLVGAFAYYDGKPTQEDRILVFVTVGIDQSKLPTEVSSYEIQRASEHFSDVLLGWTLMPAFHDDFFAKSGEEYSFTGQRQEKQNLLFQSSNYDFPVSGNPSEGDELLATLNEWIAAYNAKTNAGYTLAIQKVSFENIDVNYDAPIAGLALLSTTLAAALMFAYEYATSRRRS